MALLCNGSTEPLEVRVLEAGEAICHIVLPVRRAPTVVIVISCCDHPCGHGDHGYRDDLGHCGYHAGSGCCPDNPSFQE